jgi:hypothetical protein
MKNMLETKRIGKLDAQMGGGLVGILIGALVVVIIDVTVVIPVVNDVLNSYNTSVLNGTTRTILQIVPVLAAVFPIVVFASILR